MRTMMLTVLLLAAVPAVAGEPVRLAPARPGPLASVPLLPPLPAGAPRSPPTSPPTPAPTVEDGPLRVPFAPASAGIDASGAELLERHLPALVRTRLRILVRATAPAQESDGGAARGLAEALAAARGQAVRRWLISRRVPAERVVVQTGVAAEHAAELLVELPRRRAAPGRR